MSRARSLRTLLAGRRVGVVLSAGYFGFYGHAGFVEALRESGIEPAAWGGSSAGGLIGALAAAQVKSADIRDLLGSQRRHHFWDPDYLGIAVDSLRRGHRSSGLLKGAQFRALIERHLPVANFEQLSTPLVLLATNLSTQRPEVITRGPLAPAVHATCAYPGLFQAVRHERGLLWDGGIVDKAPALALVDSQVAELDAVLVHYLPSHDPVSEPRGPLAYAAGLSAGFSAVRRDHFRLQLEVLAARKVPTWVITSQLPPVSPKTMHAGVTALEAGRESTLVALGQPPTPWQASGDSN